MSKNPTFDDVLAYVFGTLDSVYQLHAPEKPDDENDPGTALTAMCLFPARQRSLSWKD